MEGGQVIRLVNSRGGANVFTISLEGVRQNLGDGSRSQPATPGT